MEGLPNDVNELTEEQLERLAIVGEEMAEAAQVIGKILRHGYRSYHPITRARNLDLLERELGHVRYAIESLCAAKDVDRLSIMAYAQEKSRTVVEWLHHQPAELVRRIQGMFEP